MVGILECPVGGMIICPPNGRFQLAAYWLSVMSSIVGLVGKASRPRITDGHPPNRGCDHVHIGYSCKFIFNDMAGAHASDPWGCHQFLGHEAHWWFKIHFYQFGNT